MIVEEANLISRIPSWPVHGEAEKEALARVLESGAWWRATGVENDAFEKEFAAFLGVEHVRLTSSGSGALEIALQLCDVRPGDEVLTPACTFIATASAVLRMGAIPIPVDVNQADLCIDAADLERKITERSKCVIPVHMAGHSADLDAIGTIARNHGLFVIEDAAHAHGAKWGGRALGSFGDVAIFSFQNGKLMTSGEGGAVATNIPEFAERTFALHSCGRPAGDTEYRHLEIAGNWRQSEFNAAILRAQLSRLPRQLELREANAVKLNAFMEAIPGVEAMHRDHRVDVHSHYMAMYWIQNDVLAGCSVSDLGRRLRARGVLAFKCFPPVHQTEMFAKKNLQVAHRFERAFPDYQKVDTPVAERAATNVIWLHHSLLLADEPVFELVAKLVAEELNRRTAA